MEIFEATELIRFIPVDKPMQIWADLGCGTGIFTRALARLLPTGSKIHAMDIDKEAIRKIPKEYNGVGIGTAVMDFTSGRVGLNQLDGILMANSLHYVKEKEAFLKRKLELIVPNGSFLLVDYDMDKANSWVPFPVPIDSAENLFRKCGAQTFEILNKRRSVFGERWMYAALVRK